MVHFHLSIASALLAVGLTVAFDADAQSLEDALAAYDTGDYATAEAWFLALANEGDIEAMRSLGYMFEHGVNGTRKPDDAFSWYLKAAEGGDPVASRAIGMMYEAGNGIPKDLEQAAGWYRVAAVRGHGEAQINLAYMFAAGLGVPESKLTAFMWYTLADHNGRSIALTWRSQLAREMTDQEIATAHQMAIQCLSSRYIECGW